MSAKPQSSVPQQQLNLFDCTCIIVGTIIGAGIFETTPLIAGNVTGPATFLNQLNFFGFSVPFEFVGPISLVIAWILGGLIALCGALTYAELATTYPRVGGDYVFLSKAFGRRVGFFFVWAAFWIIRPGSIGAMAYVFARYADQLVPLGLGSYGLILYACGAISFYTAMNVLGVRTGKWTQNVFTTMKVAGLLAIFATVFFLPSAASNIASPATSPPSFALALIMIMFTYGGWNDVSFVAAEVRHPQKNLLRALALGTIAVMLIYVLVSLAFVRGLGYEGVVKSDAVASDLLRSGFGPMGSRVISGLICISCLGAINGMILTGARIFYALGTEHQLYAWLGKWNDRFGAPIRALLWQAGITLALVIVFGLYKNGFERLVVFVAPIFWFFLMMVGISLYVLRAKEPHALRVYQVTFYPITPLIFCLASLFMVYSATQYAIIMRHLEGLWAVAVIVVGLVLCFSTSNQLDDLATPTNKPGKLDRI